MRVKILGKCWDLIFCRLEKDHHGDCDGPHVPSKRIRIDSQITGERELEVILHELLHAADWGLSEEYVIHQAKDTARVLWRLGYRRKKF